MTSDVKSTLKLKIAIAYTLSLSLIIIPELYCSSRLNYRNYGTCCPTPPTGMRAKSTCPRNSLQRAEIPILIQTIWLAPVGVNGWPFRNSNFPFGKRQTKTVIVIALVPSTQNVTFFPPRPGYANKKCYHHYRSSDLVRCIRTRTRIPKELHPARITTYKILQQQQQQQQQVPSLANPI